MCLILFAVDAHPDYPLILAANRDEFFARRTQSLHWWQERPDVLAGKDLVAGGTWFGIRKDGRLAAITNYRQPTDITPSISRGQLARDFLLGDATPQDYLQQLHSTADQYAGFNLLLGDKGKYFHFSNKERNRGTQHSPTMISAGVHGLSNALLDTPWPKVTRGCDALRQELKTEVSIEALFAILADTHIAADNELPDTGIGIDKERFLSSRFICSEDYGTRASTVLTINRKGEANIHHRDFVPDQPTQFVESHWNFVIDA
jgi:uncharacterized protein with NRDE domain